MNKSDFINALMPKIESYSVFRNLCTKRQLELTQQRVAELPDPIYDEHVNTYAQGFALVFDNYFAAKYTDAQEIINVKGSADAICKALEQTAEQIQHGAIIVSPAIRTILILTELIPPGAHTPKDKTAGYFWSYANLEIYISNTIKRTGKIQHGMAFSPSAIAYNDAAPEEKEPGNLVYAFGGMVVRPERLIGIDITIDEE